MKLIQIPITSELLKHNLELYNRIRHDYVPNDVIIAGGAARQIFLQEQFGETDIDIYTLSEKQDQEISKKNNLSYNNTIKSSRAISFNRKIDMGISYTRKFAISNNIKFQLIVGPYNIYQRNIWHLKSIEDIFTTFDFHCCHFALKDGYLWTTEKAQQDAIERKLTVNTNSCFKVSYNRVIKYVIKGYLPNDELTKDIFKSGIMSLLKEDNDYIQWWIKKHSVDSSKYNMEYAESQILPQPPLEQQQNIYQGAINAAAGLQAQQLQGYNYYAVAAGFQPIGPGQIYPGWAVPEPINQAGIWAQQGQQPAGPIQEVPPMRALNNLLGPGNDIPDF